MLLAADGAIQILPREPVCASDTLNFMMPNQKVLHGKNVVAYLDMTSVRSHRRAPPLFQPAAHYLKRRPARTVTLKS